MEPVDVTRARYRQDRITTLFVGESAPASWAFFYHGDSAMLRYMQRANVAPTDQIPIVRIRSPRRRARGGHGGLGTDPILDEGEAQSPAHQRAG